MTLTSLRLKKNQERRIKAGHLWIYNNEIDTQINAMTSYQPGQLVEVFSSKQQSLGIAYINPHTLLSARLLTTDSSIEINEAFFIKRLQSALSRRELLFNEPYYRLVFAESDLLPGLILDRFGDVIVGQINTAGMENCKTMITNAIVELIKPKALIWRNDSSYRQLEQLPLSVETGYGEIPEHHIVQEDHNTFYTSFTAGQKTGWFYDHRANRVAICKYAKDKNVLDVFSYVGAFAIPIAKAGAKQVTCVDSSEIALNFLTQNAKQNKVDHLIQTTHADAFAALRQFQENNQKFDLIVLDPPAFIKRKKEYHQGMHAYVQLNQLALSLLTPNGILLTASCSMHLSAADLLNCLRLASVALDRHVFILEQLHQAKDHFVHPAIEETNYLKGFILMA